MVLSWFASRVNPIAVDVGTDTIKLLQVEPSREGSHRLVAAACESIPDEVKSKAAERDAFAAEAIKRIVTDGGFRGKQVVTSLPASYMAVQHLRMAKMNPEEMTKAIQFEAAGKFPFDPARAQIRHTIAGDIYHNGEMRQEVIVMAAPRDAVDRHLSVLSRAKLEVVGIHTEPTALIECFSHIFRRKSDENISTLFIDIGASSTHVVIANGKNMVFAKHLDVCGDSLNRRVGDFLSVTPAVARDMRIKATHQKAQAPRMPAGIVAINGADNGTHPLGPQNARVADDTLTDDQLRHLEAAMAPAISALSNDLQMCMRYYEGTFPDRCVDRIIFVGGESRHIALCQSIAQMLHLPATLGDPLARLVKDNAAKTSVDLRQPQPGWAIAMGLALGLAPQTVEKEV